MTPTVMNKEDVLSAIDTRMSAFGKDHDAIVRIEEMLKVSIADRAKINDVLFGPNRDDGIIGWIADFKGKLIWIYVADRAMFAMIGWLIAIHLVK
jgi:hypothetical protein